MKTILNDECGRWSQGSPEISAKADRRWQSLLPSADDIHRAPVGIERNRTDAFTVQAHNVVTHGGKHAFHLMVASFADGQTDLRRGDDLKHGGFGQILFIIQLNAFRELLCRVIRNR